MCLLCQFARCSSHRLLPTRVVSVLRCRPTLSAPRRISLQRAPPITCLFILPRQPRGGVPYITSTNTPGNNNSSMSMPSRRSVGEKDLFKLGAVLSFDHAWDLLLFTLVIRVHIINSPLTLTLESRECHEIFHLLKNSHHGPIRLHTVAQNDTHRPLYSSFGSSSKPQQNRCSRDLSARGTP